MAALKSVGDERSAEHIILAKMHMYADALNQMKVTHSDEIPTSVEDDVASERSGLKEGRRATEHWKNAEEKMGEGKEAEETKIRQEEGAEGAEAAVKGESDGGLVRKKPTAPSGHQQKLLSEALKSKLYDSMDKDGSYFSYIFLEKMYDDIRKCCFCGSIGFTKPSSKEDSLELYIGEAGVVGRQTIECTKCGQTDTVTSGRYAEEVPTDTRLKIEGVELRYFCKKVTHFEVLHDLMELLHIAAMDDEAMRREKHAEVAEFMLQNVRKVCEDWCKPEYAELRMKKYLRLREETLLTTYDPKFTPNRSDEYIEMYGMIADSFRQNRNSILLLLSLLKDTLIENPSRPTFMMWVSIGMMHTESYHRFKSTYDPRSFMRVDETEYSALKDRYLALDVPLGIKKIPVVFVMFEIPRFYHYIDFLTRRLGKSRPRPFLSQEEHAKVLELSDEGQRLGIKKEPRSGQMISPEAHLDLLTKKEEMERAMIYHSCRDRDLMRVNTEYTLGLRDLMPQPESRQTGKPVVMSTDEFRTVLYDHLKKNAASPANQAAPISPGYPPGSNPHSRQARREAKRGRRRKHVDYEEDDKKTVLVAQVDTDLLRRQGFRVSANSKTTTVVYSKDGKLEHILEGIDTPEQVKAFLSQKYKSQAVNSVAMPKQQLSSPSTAGAAAGVMEKAPPTIDVKKAGSAKKKQSTQQLRQGGSDGGAPPIASKEKSSNETPSPVTINGTLAQEGGVTPASAEDVTGKKRKKRKPRKSEANEGVFLLDAWDWHCLVCLCVCVQGCLVCLCVCVCVSRAAHRKRG